MDISKLTIAEARRALDAKEYSVRELTDAFLATAETQNPETRAYLEIWTDHARKEAKRADAMIEGGKSEALTGIPLAIKDNILLEGRIASAASKMLENYKASYDATVITKLKKQGAVFIGRTNMDEFAMGSSTENSAYGPTKNPLDLSRVPGGSSGGSAAAVAMGSALGALGSDTGGSIRQPAAFCGVVGLKPTYGEVSRYGLMAMAASLNQIGQLAKTVADTRVLFDATRGHDPLDSMSFRDEPKQRHSPKKIGVLRKFVEREGLDAAMLANFNSMLRALSSRGFSLKDVELPSLEYALPVYYIITPAEVSTDLARYDGIRYGLSLSGENIQDVYLNTRRAGFGPEVRRRILVGSFVLSAGYADAYYRKARAVRDLIRSDFQKAFADVDAIVTPTTPSVAFRFGERSDPLAMYLEDIFTVPANIAGIPAISVPSGFIDKDGKPLPAGFQIIGPSRSENMLFEIAAVVESAT